MNTQQDPNPVDPDFWKKMREKLPTKWYRYFSSTIKGSLRTFFVIQKKDK